MSIHRHEDPSWYEKVSAKVESKGPAFMIWTFIAIAIGGAVEIIPPLFIHSLTPEATSPDVTGVKPYNALELAGRDVYQAEGCFYCHTQMIRPFKWETDRWDRNKAYGPAPYSKSEEYKYEHPFLWGSKRTGPDLWHEGNLNNNTSWHKDHLVDPRNTSPGSIMPSYAALFKRPVSVASTQANMRGLRTLGVPYSDADIEKAATLLKGKSKGDALVAYLVSLSRSTQQK